MPAPQFYNQRMTEDLKREVAWVIANELRDPRLPEMITVTDIKLSSDTRNATVFVSFYEEGEHASKDALSALTHAAPFIQKMVASRVKIKNFPKMVFKQDNGFEHSAKINELLEQVKDDLERD